MGGRHERGVDLVPLLRPRMAIVVAATAYLALAMLGFVVFAGAFADDPGESRSAAAGPGWSGWCCSGWRLHLARRGWTPLAAAAVPSAVVIAAGGWTVVPWAIQQLRAAEVTTHVRGVAVSEPLVGIDLSDPEAIQTGPLERLPAVVEPPPGHRHHLPVRALDIDPALLLEALRCTPRRGTSSRPRPAAARQPPAVHLSMSRPARDGDTSSAGADSAARHAHCIATCCNGVPGRVVVTDERPDNAQTRVALVQAPGDYLLAQGRAGRLSPSP